VLKTVNTYVQRLYSHENVLAHGEHAPLRREKRSLTSLKSLQSRSSSPPYDNQTASGTTPGTSSPCSVKSELSLSSVNAKVEAATITNNPSVQEKLAKLKRLLATSTAFSSIIAERVKTQKIERAAAMKKKQEEEAASQKNANGKRGQSSSGTSPSKRAKVEEDAPVEPTIVKNEEILYMKQPETVSGATLRDYQLAGVQWLSLLYENGQSARPCLITQIDLNRGSRSQRDSGR
jgi:SNF2 family DNA or RNA helicase